MLFQNRAAAGFRLAGELRVLENRDDVIVLALPRGGVPVGYEVATALRLPLDVLVVRKIGLPGYPELAVGALASNGVLVFSEEVGWRRLGATPEAIAPVIAAERAELRRRERLFREDRPIPDLHDKTVILVDDGVATGSTMEAAVLAARQGLAPGHAAPKQIIVAVPVGTEETCRRLEQVADEVVCLENPPDFDAVGQFYTDFHQLTDEEVQIILRKARICPPHLLSRAA